MSKLDELIEEYCPQGAVFKPLGEVVKFINGRAYKQPELLNDGKYKVLRVGNFHTNDKWYYSDLELDEDKYCNDGDLLYTWAATLGPQIWHGDKVIFHYHIWKLVFDENVLDKRFLYHFLQMDIDTISKSLTQSTMPHVSMESMNKRTVPVPPLPVQREIVRILDKFTELTAELTAKLTAELTALKKQYKYYNNYLLSFEYRDDVPMSKLEELIAELCPDGVEYKCIGEIANCYPGATPKTSKPEYWEKGTIPWMSSGEVNYGEVTFTEKKITQLGYDNSSTKMVPANTVVIALAGQGKTRGTVAITRIPLCTNQSLCAIVTKENILSEFLLYFLRSQYQQLRDVSSGDGTRGGLNLKMINVYKVPVPPMPVQSEIVRILDNFTELTSELTSELTAELTARKKQYEYYRDKLLTFKELS